MVIQVQMIGLCVLIASISIPQQAIGRELRSKPGDVKPVFVLDVQPNPVSAHRGQPINLVVKITNVTANDAYLWLFFKPTAFGSDTDMGCLMMRCRNQKTGKDVRYRWSPPGRTTQDAQMRELVDKIPAGSSTWDTINLTDWCDLPPGSYLLELQYETQHIPTWIKPDKRAWHGLTNKVLIKVHVLKRLHTKYDHLRHRQPRQERLKVLPLLPPQ